MQTNNRYVYEQLAVYGDSDKSSNISSFMIDNIPYIVVTDGNAGKVLIINHNTMETADSITVDSVESIDTFLSSSNEVYLTITVNDNTSNTDQLILKFNKDTSKFVQTYTEQQLNNSGTMVREVVDNGTHKLFYITATYDNDITCREMADNNGTITLSNTQTINVPDVVLQSTIQNGNGLYIALRVYNSDSKILNVAFDGTMSVVKTLATTDNLAVEICKDNMGDICIFTLHNDGASLTLNKGSLDNLTAYTTSVDAGATLSTFIDSDNVLNVYTNKNNYTVDNNKLTKGFISQTTYGYSKLFMFNGKQVIVGKVDNTTVITSVSDDEYGNTSKTLDVLNYTTEPSKELSSFKIIKDGELEVRGTNNISEYVYGTDRYELGFLPNNNSVIDISTTNDASIIASGDMRYKELTTVSRGVNLQHVKIGSEDYYIGYDNSDIILYKNEFNNLVEVSKILNADLVSNPFIIDNDTCIAKLTGTTINILKFNGETFDFFNGFNTGAPVGNISSIEIMNFGTDTFISVSVLKDSDGSHDTSSIVFKYDRISKEFKHYQDLATKGANVSKKLVDDNVEYIIFSGTMSGTSNVNSECKVYKYTEDGFVYRLSLSVSNLLKMEVGIVNGKPSMILLSNGDVSTIKVVSFNGISPVKVEYTNVVSTGDELSFMDVYKEPMILVNGTLYKFGKTSLVSTSIEYLYSGIRTLLTVGDKACVANKHNYRTVISEIINDDVKVDLVNYDNKHISDTLSSIATDYNVEQTHHFSYGGEEFVLVINQGNPDHNVYKLTKDGLLSVSSLHAPTTKQASLTIHNGDVYFAIVDSSDYGTVYKWVDNHFVSTYSFNMANLAYAYCKSLNGELYVLFANKANDSVCKIQKGDGTNTLLDVTTTSQSYGSWSKLITTGGTDYLLTADMNSAKIQTFDGTALSNELTIANKEFSFIDFIEDASNKYMVCTDKVNSKIYVYSWAGDTFTELSVTQQSQIEATTTLSIDGLIYLYGAGVTNKLYLLDIVSENADKLKLLETYNENSSSKQINFKSGNDKFTLTTGSNTNGARRIYVVEHNVDNLNILNLISSKKHISDDDGSVGGNNVNTFNINGETFIVHNNITSNGFNVLKNVNGTFVNVQHVTNSNYSVAQSDIIHYNGEILLALSWFTESSDSGQGIFVYKWDGTQFTEIFRQDSVNNYEAHFSSTNDGLFISMYVSQYSSLTSTPVFKYNGTTFVKQFDVAKNKLRYFEFFNVGSKLIMVYSDTTSTSLFVNEINGTSYTQTQEITKNNYGINNYLNINGSHYLINTPRNADRQSVYKHNGTEFVEVSYIDLLDKTTYIASKVLNNGYILRQSETTTKLYKLVNDKLVLIKDFVNSIQKSGIGLNTVDNKLWVTHDTLENSKRVINIETYDVSNDVTNKSLSLVDNKTTNKFLPTPLALETSVIADNYNIEKPSTDYAFDIDDSDTNTEFVRIHVLMGGVDYLIYSENNHDRLQIATYENNVITVIQTINFNNGDKTNRSAITEYNGEYFLAVSVYNANADSDTTVYKWGGTQFVSIFTINGYSWDVGINVTQLGMLLINYTNGGSETILYKYDGTTFVQMYNIPDVKLLSTQLFSIGDKTFLIGSVYQSNAYVYQLGASDATKSTQLYNNTCSLLYGKHGKDHYIFVLAGGSSGDFKTYKYDGTTFVLVSSITSATDTATCKETLVYNGELYMPRYGANDVELYKLIDDTPVKVSTVTANLSYSGFLFEQNNNLIFSYDVSVDGTKKINFKTMHFKDEAKPVLSRNIINNVTNVIPDNKLIKSDDTIDIPNSKTYTVSIGGTNYLFVNDGGDLKSYKYVNNKLVLNKIYFDSGVETMSFAKDSGDVYCVMLLPNNVMTANYWDGTQFVETNRYALANPYTPIFATIDNTLSIIATMTDGNMLWYKLDNKAFPDTPLTGVVSINIKDFKATTKPDGTCLLICGGTDTNVVSLTGTTLTIEQTLSINTSSVNSFKIDNKDFFVVGAYNGKKYSTLFMYIDNKYVEVQKINTPQVKSIENFEYKGLTYLAFSANKSTVIKVWNGYKFVHYQTIFSKLDSKTSVIQTVKELNVLINKTAGVNLYKLTNNSNSIVSDISCPVDINTSIKGSVNDSIRVLNKQIITGITSTKSVNNGRFYNVGSDTYLYVLCNESNGSLTNINYKLVNNEFKRLQYNDPYFKFDSLPVTVDDTAYVTTLENISYTRFLYIHKLVNDSFEVIAKYEIPDNKIPTKAIIYEHNSEPHILYSGGDSVAEVIKVTKYNQVIHVDTPASITSTKQPLEYIKTIDKEFMLIGGDEFGKCEINADGTLGDYAQQDANPSDNVGIFEFMGSKYIVYSSYGSSTTSKINIAKYESGNFTIKQSLIVDKTATNIMVSEYDNLIYLYTGSNDDINITSSLHIFTGLSFIKYKDVERNNKIIPSSTIINDKVYTLGTDNINGNDVVVVSKVVNVTKQDNASLSIFGRNCADNEFDRLSVVLWGDDGVAKEISNINKPIGSLDIIKSYTVNEYLSYVIVADKTIDNTINLFKVSNGKLEHTYTLNVSNIESVDVIHDNNTVYIGYISNGKVSISKILNNTSTTVHEQGESIGNSDIKLIKYNNTDVTVLYNKADKTVVSIIRNDKIIQPRLIINNTSNKDILYDVYNNSKSIKGMVSGTNTELFKADLSLTDAQIVPLYTHVDTDFTSDAIKTLYPSLTFNSNDLPAGVTVDADGTVHGKFTETGQGTMYLTGTTASKTSIVPYAYKSDYTDTSLAFDLTTSGSVIVDASDSQQLTQVLSINVSSGNYSSGKVIKDGVELATLSNGTLSWDVDLSTLVDNLNSIQTRVTTESIKLDITLIDANDNSEVTKSITYDVGCKPATLNNIIVKAYTDVANTINETKNEYDPNKGYTISGSLPAYLTKYADNSLVVNTTTLYKNDITTLTVTNKYGTALITIDTSVIDKIEFALNQDNHGRIRVKSDTTTLPTTITNIIIKGIPNSTTVTYNAGTNLTFTQDDGVNINFDAMQLVNDKNSIYTNTTVESYTLHVTLLDEYGFSVSNDIIYSLGASPYVNSTIPALNGKVNTNVNYDEINALVTSKSKIKYSSTDIIGGLSVDGISAVITGTPTVVDNGVFTINGGNLYGVTTINVNYDILTDDTFTTNIGDTVNIDISDSNKRMLDIIVTPPQGETLTVKLYDNDNNEVGTFTDNGTTLTYTMDTQNGIVDPAPINNGDTVFNTTYTIKAIDQHDNNTDKSFTLNVGTTKINNKTSNEIKCYVIDGQSLTFISDVYKDSKGYSFTVKNGDTIPQGLTLQSTGIIDGTPTEKTNIPFNVIVTNNFGSFEYSVTTDIINKMDALLNESNTILFDSNSRTSLDSILHVFAGSVKTITCLYNGTAIDVGTITIPSDTETYDVNMHLKLNEVISDFADISNGVKPSAIFKFDIQLIDEHNRALYRHLSVDIGATTKNITLPQLTGIVNNQVDYSGIADNYKVSDGYSYDTASGLNGVNLNTDSGMLSGTPTQESTGDIAVSLINKYGHFDVNVPYNITKDFIVTGTTAPAFIYQNDNTTYNITTAGQDVQNVTFDNPSIKSATKTNPIVITLRPDSTILGTVAFEFTITGSDGKVITHTDTIEVKKKQININKDTIQITLLNGTAFDKVYQVSNSSYDANIVVTNGTLPNGISLGLDASDNLRISGTPDVTTGGIVNVTLEMTAHNGTKDTVGVRFDCNVPMALPFTTKKYNGIIGNTETYTITIGGTVTGISHTGNAQAVSLNGNDIVVNYKYTAETEEDVNITLTNSVEQKSMTLKFFGKETITINNGNTYPETIAIYNEDITPIAIPYTGTGVTIQSHTTLGSLDVSQDTDTKTLTVTGSIPYDGYDDSIYSMTIVDSSNNTVTLDIPFVVGDRPTLTPVSTALPLNKDIPVSKYITDNHRDITTVEVLQELPNGISVSVEDEKVVVTGRPTVLFNGNMYIKVSNTFGSQNLTIPLVVVKEINIPEIQSRIVDISIVDNNPVHYLLDISQYTFTNVSVDNTSGLTVSVDSTNLILDGNLNRSFGTNIPVVLTNEVSTGTIYFNVIRRESPKISDVDKNKHLEYTIGDIVNEQFVSTKGAIIGTKVIGGTLPNGIELKLENGAVKLTGKVYSKPMDENVMISAYNQFGRDTFTIRVTTYNVETLLNYVSSRNPTEEITLKTAPLNLAKALDGNLPADVSVVVNNDGSQVINLPLNNEEYDTNTLFKGKPKQ